MDVRVFRTTPRSGVVRSIHFNDISHICIQHIHINDISHICISNDISHICIQLLQVSARLIEFCQ